MVDLQVKGLRVGSLHNSDIVAGPLVGLGQGIRAPVSPVYLTTIKCDSKGVRQILMPSEHLNVACTIVEGRIDSIGPVEEQGRFPLISLFLCVHFLLTLHPGYNNSIKQITFAIIKTTTQ